MSRQTLRLTLNITFACLLALAIMTQGTRKAHARGGADLLIGLGVGVVLGAVLPPPVVYARPPVYVPAPVYVEPAPVYVEPTPYYAPVPVPVPFYAAPRFVPPYGYGGYGSNNGMAPGLRCHQC